MIDQTACERWNGYNSFDMYCDTKGCQESQTFDDMIFSDMIKEAKTYGWTMEKDKNDWFWWHICPTCSEKETNKPLSDTDIQEMEDEHIAEL